MNAPLPPTALPILAPLAAIFTSPTNPRKRFPAAAHEEMTASIRLHNVLQPILLRPWPKDGRLPVGKCIQDLLDVPGGTAYELVAGERRFRGAVAAPLESILAIVRELTDVQVLEIQLIENLQREDVHPLEEAEGFERLIKEAKYTADTLGEKIGQSRAYIYARLKLLALPPATRELFYDGKLNASTALLIARIPVPALQIKAAAEITKPNWQGDCMSHRAAKEHIQSNYMLDLTRATFKLADAKLIPAAGSCDACPKKSGNDRVLFADISSADICTDPPCFQEKRQVNYLRLLALAEKSGKKLITGDEAKRMLASGTYSLGQFDLTSPDDTCYQDDAHRTYRDILGKDFPAITLVDDSRAKGLVEAVDSKALAAALKNAGIGAPVAQRDWAAERAEREAKAKTENAWRAKLFQAVRLKFGERFAESKVLAPEELSLLALNLFKKEAESGGEDCESIMALWGHPAIVDEDYEAQTAAFSAFLLTLGAAELCLFLIDLCLIDETEVAQWQFDEQQDIQPTRLLAEARRFGIDPEAFRDPADAPKKAAKSKANEPAEPTPTPPSAAHPKSTCFAAPETTNPPGSTSTALWPFPMGARR